MIGRIATLCPQIQQQDLDRFANLRRWFEAIRARPAVQRAYTVADTVNTAPTVDEEAKKLLFGQTTATLARAGK